MSLSLRSPATLIPVIALALPWHLVHAQPPPALVVVAPAVEQEVSAGQTFVGTVMPLARAVIGSAVDGRVIEFPLREGDRVERGQTLAQLLTDTISLEVETAEAELELRKQQLAELENGTRPEEIEQARARMTGAHARLQYLTARRTRIESLFRAGRAAVSEEERDEAVSDALEAEQTYLEAKHAYELAVAGPRPEQIAQARAQVAMQQAIANRLKDQLAKHTIVARFAGYVTAEHTEVGGWVKQGDPVAEVAALDVVEIVTHVVEQFIPFARQGEVVRVEVPALPGQLFTGEISAVVPQADVQARTFPVKVRIQNELTDDGPLLKSGMYARMVLPTGSKRTATLVPKDALVLGGPQPVVYVVDRADANSPQGTARPVPAQLGVAAGSLIQITGELNPGDLVVVQGNERLTPGRGVIVQRVLPAEASSPGSSTTPLSQTDHP